MNKNVTTNQILLIALATILFLLAALSFYLLTDLNAPLPFAPAPPSSTFTALPPSLTYTIGPTSTSVPTRQTSYTPFATHATSSPETSLEATGTPENSSPSPSDTNSPGSTIQPSPTATSRSTSTPSTSTSTFTPSTPGAVTPIFSPTPSPTLVAGQHPVTGRIVQSSTPVANILVEFADDDPPRDASTNSGGRYSFITLSPGTTFTLSFSQADNPQLIPVSEVAPIAWIEGTIPIGIDTIDLPDLEVSLNTEGIFFELQTPVEGATFSAAAISPTNPIQFIWSPYNQGNSYHVELGKNGSADPIWTSSETDLTNLWWNGTLDDGGHITEGTYWWQVAVRKTLGDYTLVVYTQKSDLIFNP
jgi:hypothetical protein